MYSVNLPIDRGIVVIVTFWKRIHLSDKLIETPTYLAKMKEVESVVDKLHLTDLYR